MQIRANRCQKTVKYLCGVVNGVEEKQQNRTKNFLNVKLSKHKKKRSKPLRFQTFPVGPSVEIRTQGLLNPMDGGMPYIVSVVVNTSVKAAYINLYFSRYFHYFRSDSGMNSGTKKLRLQKIASQY